MASSDSKWVPKYPPDPKTTFESPYAPYGHIKHFFTKSMFGLENAIFKLEAFYRIYDCTISKRMQTIL